MKSHKPMPREPAMEPEAFGRALIETGDLDPVYVMLKRAALPHAQLCRWLIAYWCLYHSGAASMLSENQATFWAQLRVAAGSVGNDPWPRNVERRHFRGQKAVDAVRWMSCLPPEQIVSGLCGGPYRQADVMARIQEWPMFGPWIAFKAADMLEVLGLARIDFNPDLPLIYAEPRKGLKILAERRGVPMEHAFAALRMYFANIEVPWGGRMCGVQEVETVLCKWKSHAGGNQQAYWVGHDIAGLRRDLGPRWGDTAAHMLTCAPPDVDRGVRPGAIPPVKPPPVSHWTPENRERQRQQARAQHAGTYVKKGNAT